MWILFLTFGVVALQTFQSPSALGCNIAQLQQLLCSSKCELHWDIQNIPLSCRHSTDPNITEATVLYNTSLDKGHLWFGNKAVPNCSSVAPPAPLTCTVCYDQFLHMVCSNLRTEDGMVELEDVNGSVTTIKSACPRSLGVGLLVQLMAQPVSALTCSVTHLSNGSDTYRFSLQLRSDTKLENQTINWQKTKCTVNCTCPRDEVRPAHDSSPASAEEAARQRTGVITAVAVAVAVAVAIICGIWKVKCTKSKSAVETVRYTCPTQNIQV